MKALKNLLQKELIMALGCTEPIAIALCCARAGEEMTQEMKKINLHLSASVIKNANSVYVPNAKGRKGILIAAALGFVSHASGLKLRVLQNISDEDIRLADELIAEGRLKIIHEKDCEPVYIRAEIIGESDVVNCIVEGGHENLCYLEKNGRVLFDTRHKKDILSDSDTFKIDIDDIFNYARTVDFEEEKELRELLLMQAKTNKLIAQEGLNNPWGERVGKTLLDLPGSEEQQSIAFAAAGSDARMGGCSKPVIINAGSGNQGITCSVPVIMMAEHLKSSEDTLLRALMISNLVALYEKHFIGKLSAFCGAISAAAAAGCAVGYLKGLDDEQLKMVVINALATAGGVICDGAKASCAAKIASGLQAAFTGLHMAEKGFCFKHGDGIVGKDVDETIRSIGEIASIGMSPTNDVILDIMTR